MIPQYPVPLACENMISDLHSVISCQRFFFNLELPHMIPPTHPVSQYLSPAKIGSKASLFTLCSLIYF